MPQKYLSAQSIMKCGAVLGLEHMEAEGGWKAREKNKLVDNNLIIGRKMEGPGNMKTTDVNIFSWELLTPGVRNIQPMGYVSPMK